MSKLCKDCACENVCGITHLPENEACVYYKTEAITELEKIKAEIKQQGSIHVKYRRTEDIDHLVDSIVYQCKDGFCNYIDNHIKELKGENNEDSN